MSTLKSKKPPLLIRVCGLILMIGVIASILLLNNQTVDAQSIAKNLQQLAERVSQDASKVGKEAVFTHGPVEILGTGYDKYAVIHGLSLTLSNKNSDQADYFAAETSKVIVSLDPLNARRLIFKFGEAVTFSHNGQKTLVTFSMPLKLGYLENDSSAPGSLVTVRVPPQMTLAAASGVDEPKQLPLVISYDGMPEISLKNLVSLGQSEGTYEVRNVIVQSGIEQKVTIGAISNTINEKLASDHHVDGTFYLTVSDFTRRNGPVAKTCSITSNIGYNSTESLMNFAGLPKADISAKLNRLVLACDDFTIKLDGDVVHEAADTSPSGLVNVTINNVKAFLASDLISDQTRSELTAALPRIVGHAIDAEANVAFTVKRDKAGPMMLGAVSLNESGVTALKEIFPAPPPVPAQPVVMTEPGAAKPVTPAESPKP